MGSDRPTPSTEPGQSALAEKAAKSRRGALRHGRWLVRPAARTDNAGLGDWYVNQKKFPNGLKPLIDRVHSLGMDFGLWVEPEMVNPNSDLYRAHPDWGMNFPDRQRTEARQSAHVLNLARPEVKATTSLGFLEKLVTLRTISPS